MSTSSLSLAGKDSPGARLRRRYEQMWSAAIGQIRSGAVKTDRVLAAGIPDRRRGLTLIARPSPKVRREVVAFLGRLRRLEPDQYFYSASELHVTILSLFTATVDHRPLLDQTEVYAAAVRAALQMAEPLRIEFRGVTASPEAILVQGFPQSDALNRIRGAIRRELRARGLSNRLDERYRLETAHMTVARFCVRLKDGQRFAAVLERSRQLLFGTTVISTLSLVKNDWYMSRLILEMVKRYRLEP
jgi:2'-5' RNA ligase